MNMNPKVITGIAIALALIIIGGWYWLFMTPRALAPTDNVATSTPDQSINGAAMDTDSFAASLAGDWRSRDDAKFTREFTAGGRVTDRYEGITDATIVGEWSLVTDPAKESVSLPNVTDAKIMKIQFPEEVLYFAVNGITATDLSMIYLNGAGNGNLEFSRVR